MAKNLDLMGFESPEQKSSGTCINHISPGDNPFDVLSKNADWQSAEKINDLEYFMKCDPIGRESLGILKLDSLSTSFDLPSPNLNIDHLNSKDVINSPLNVCYLQIPSFQLRDKSVSISSGSRFNSGSLEASEPSNICSVDFERSDNILNDAFVATKSEDGLKLLLSNTVNNESRGVGCHEINLDDSLDDSVFVATENVGGEAAEMIKLEAINVASSIADGSIMYSRRVGDNTLDGTSPPKLFDLDEPKPVDDLELDNKPDGENEPSNEIDEKEIVKKNLSNIFSNSERRRSKGSSSSEGSTKDPNEILINLSAIINNERRDSRQSQEGQQLLYSLADILCSENSPKSNCKKNLDDSGHSSIEQDQNDEDIPTCFEVLDLRVISKSSDDMQALDLSARSKTDGGSRRLSQSFTLPSPPKLFNKLKSHGPSVSLIASGKLATPINDISKLKPKKVEDKLKSVKGPLKAVIPVVDMAKRRTGGSGKISFGNVTPPKLATTHGSSIFGMKRTSTPIVEPQLKPVAQSTPAVGQPTLERNKPNSCSSQLKKRKFYCPVSPLIQNNGENKSMDLNSTKSSQSNSTPNLSIRSKKDSSLPSPKFMYRRHSATELKTGDSKAPLARSYSIGSANKPNIVSKLKKSIAMVTPPRKNSAGTPERKGTLSEVNNVVMKSSKSSGLLGKFRKSVANKENCPRK